MTPLVDLKGYEWTSDNTGGGIKVRRLSRRTHRLWRTLVLYQWQLTVYLGGHGKIRPRAQGTALGTNIQGGKQPNSSKQSPAGDYYRGTKPKQTSTTWRDFRMVSDWREDLIASKQRPDAYAGFCLL